jgi:4-amino-4-deoxy-L-arabinose transferase-like glycosyltransferase
MSVRRAIAAAVLARAAIACAAWSLHGTAAFLSPDSNSYLVPASSIAAHLTFVDVLGRPEIFRTPGYPLLLAPGVLIGHPVRFALVLQTCAAAVVVALTYAMAQRTLDRRTAALCAWIVALEPTMMLWSIKVMPEALFVLCLVAFAAFAQRAIETARPGWTAAAAAALCGAAYVKPIAYPLVILLPIVIGMVGLVQWRSPHKGLTHAVVFAIVAAVLVAPWHARNLRAAGYAGFSSITDYALYLSVGGSVMARHAGESFVDVRARLLEETPRESPRAGAGAYASMRHEGLRQLSSDPLAYAVIHVRGVVRTLLDPGAVEYLRIFGLYPEHGGALARTLDRGLAAGLSDLARRSPLAFWSSVVMALVLLPLIVAPLIGWIRMRHSAPPAFLLYMLLAAYFIIAGGGVPGSSRFRVPAVPLLALMTGYAVQPRRATVVIGAPAG